MKNLRYLFRHSEQRTGIALLSFLCCVVNPAYSASPLPAAKSVLNARDEYIAAGKLVREKDQIGAALQVPYLSRKKPPLPLSEKERLLRINAPVLQRVRVALRHPYHRPLTENEDDFRSYPAIRQLSRLLVLEGEVHRIHGHGSAAARNFIETIRLGEQVQAEEPMIGAMVGTAIETQGRGRLWEMVDHLTAAEARAAGLQLDQAMSFHIYTYRTIEAEKRFMMAALEKSIAKANSGVPRKTGDETMDDLEEEDYISTRMALLLNGQSGLKDRFSRFMDRMIQRVKGPFRTVMADPDHPTPTQRVTAWVDPTGDYFNSLEDTVESLWLKEHETAAKSRLLRVMLALRAFHEDHHRLPYTLPELVPRYLSRIPNDPFEEGKQLHYRLRSTGYRLYSIGPDLRDNHGVPIDEPSPDAFGNKQARYAVKPESLGDIVAGVSLP